MESEKQLLETLQSWEDLKRQLKRLEMSLQAKDYRITSGFSEAPSFGSGNSPSKVEEYVFSLMETKNEIKEIKARMNLCISAFEKARLTQTERLAIQYTCSARSLLQLSKDLNISQARIYRIRDKGISKMFAEIQNEGKR